jgi:hypothetical protein
MSSCAAAHGGGGAVLVDDAVPAEAAAEPGLLDMSGDDVDPDGAPGW